MDIDITLIRDGEEITVVADADYLPGSRGYRNSMGVPEEPDEDPGWELNGITGEDGGEVELTDAEIDEVFERLQKVDPNCD